MTEVRMALQKTLEAFWQSHPSLCLGLFMVASIVWVCLCLVYSGTLNDEDFSLWSIPLVLVPLFLMVWLRIDLLVSLVTILWLEDINKHQSFLGKKAAPVRGLLFLDLSLLRKHFMGEILLRRKVTSGG